MHAGGAGRGRRGKLEGSYAAVIVDPVSRALWAVKQGSSLYFGIGQGDEGGGVRHRLVGSLLGAQADPGGGAAGPRGSSSSTTPRGTQIYGVTDRSSRRPRGSALPAGAAVDRAPVRSRLRAKDTALLPPFETFMDQEISAQEQTCRNVVTLFLGGSEAAQLLRPYLESRCPSRTGADRRRPWSCCATSTPTIRSARAFHALVDGAALPGLLEQIPARAESPAAPTRPPEQLADRLVSSEAGFFADLLAMARGEDDLVAVRLLDVLLERTEVRGVRRRRWSASPSCAIGVPGRGGRIFVVCCGTSYHAAKAAALFFNEIARTELVPVLPGEFRAQYACSLRDGDLFIAVSQSGETKDLIDVMNYVIALGPRHRARGAGEQRQLDAGPGEEPAGDPAALRARDRRAGHQELHEPDGGASTAWPCGWASDARLRFGPTMPPAAAAHEARLEKLPSLPDC